MNGMNNEYDREPLTETVTITTDAIEPSIKLVIMQSGAQIIAEVIEYMHADYYTFVDPRTVQLEITTENGQETIQSIPSAAWAPLSADKPFEVYKSAVVSVCNAIPSLEESYKGARLNG